MHQKTLPPACPPKISSGIQTTMIPEKEHIASCSKVRYVPVKLAGAVQHGVLNRNTMHGLERIEETSVWKGDGGGRGY